MVDDPEQRLLSGLADHDARIKKIQEEVSDLTANKELNDLTNKVEDLTEKIAQIELSGFQEQISSLNKNINNLQNTLLLISRESARFEMEFIQFHVRNSIRTQLDNPERGKILEYIAVQYARASEKIKTSSTPLSIMIEFRAECVKCSKEHNLNAFG